MGRSFTGTGLRAGIGGQYAGRAITLEPDGAQV